MTSTTRANNEFAWQVHTAMEGWTGRADLKASILLALQGGALFALLASSGPLDRADLRWPALVTIVAPVLLLGAVLLSTAALIPLLGSPKSLKAEHSRHFVYFGHIRHWAPADLGPALTRLTTDDEAAMLAQQIVKLGKLNWLKHRLLQASVAVTVLALLLLAVSVIGTA